MSDFSKLNDLAVIDAIIDDTGIVPAVNQIELHPTFQPHDLISHCADLGIVIEAWNAETGSPLVVRTFAWDPTGPFSDFHYCGPGIWSLAGIDAAAKRVRIRATTNEATPTAWRSRTGLAIRRSGALTAEQNRRLNRWILAAVGTPAAILVLFITFLAELAARRSQPSDTR